MVKAVMEKGDNIPGWVDALSRDMETIKMKILEKNNSVAEIKNAFSDFASRFKIAGKRANGLENWARSIEITQSETQREKKKKKKEWYKREQSIQWLKDNTKWSNVCIIETAGAQMVKNLSTMQETWVRSLGWEDPLEKGMATHSNILAWRIPWTEELGRLQFMGSQRVWYYWVTNTFTYFNFQENKKNRGQKKYLKKYE